MSEHPRAGVAVWVLVALAGLAIAVLLSVAASNLSTQPIGLAGEPLRASDRLAPAVETQTTATTTHPKKRPRTKTQATSTHPVPTATTVAPVLTPTPAPTTTATPTQTQTGEVGHPNGDDRRGPDHDADDD